ncbi:cytochrome C [Paraferrimonas sedimenticola]|uniref:Cytochrome c n=1 Tax=Paraferrimonas sedimenticola TaxID=375674 RepID=A0AA37RWB5_9GAMM|nr:cytochrome C [Paraferrimonas sedimenticola]GLP96456.1 cytochrome c [Paraferrimonas sedimenticola]
MKLERRQAITKIIGITGAAAGSVLLPSSLQAQEMAGDNMLTPADLQNLEYAKLDAMAVAKLAYDADVRNKGCMYQVFHAIVTKLAESSSPDAAKFAAIPTALSIYGSGGIFGQGTICGNNNAAGMLLKLLKVPNAEGKNGQIVGAIYRYYESTPLPYMDDEFVTGIGANPEDTATKVVAASVAKSFMCHSSISNWSDASGLNAKQKGERCQRLSASMAHYIVTLLNRIVDGEDVDLAAISLPEGSAGECVECHGTSYTFGDAPSTMTGMDCVTCHTGHFN